MSAVDEAAPPAGEARAGRVPRLTLAVAAVWVALDQLTKSLALEHLSGREPVELFWTLQLRLSFNSGAAFGIGRGITPLLTAAGIVLLLVLLAVTRRATTTGARLALGLILGGAVGNLVDRLFRDHGGAVVDFIDLQWWPVFNVADIGITIGAVLFVVFTGK